MPNIVTRNSVTRKIATRLAAGAAAAGFLGTVVAIGPTLAAENGGSSTSVPIFTTDSDAGWVPDRPTGDDFLPPAGGPGPVMSVRDRPYVPNGLGRQPTYRIADLTNPILKPWAAAQMKKANDEVIAGKVPYITRERCWPAGVPGFTVYTRVQPIYFLQTAKEVVIINELNAQVRHVYLNVPHTAAVAPSWYGESVGHYEGDELVIDTIGLNDKTFVDNYRTPHTGQIHVAERFKMIEGGKTLQSIVTVDDPGAFNMPWSATQRWRRVNRSMTEIDLRRKQLQFLQLRRSADTGGDQSRFLKYQVAEKVIPGRAARREPAIHALTRRSGFRVSVPPCTRRGMTLSHQPRPPKIALPTRTWVAPNSIATAKSALMPMDNNDNPLRRAIFAARPKCKAGGSFAGGMHITPAMARS